MKQMVTGRDKNKCILPGGPGSSNTCSTDTNTYTHRVDAVNVDRKQDVQPGQVRKASVQVFHEIHTATVVLVHYRIQLPVRMEVKLEACCWF